MGVGDPLEAAIAIDTPIPAGPWHLVGDGIIFAPVDVRFDLLRRRPPKDDQMIVGFMHHFEQPTDPARRFNAVAYEETLPGIAVPDVKKGDQLVLRFTTQSPNGGAPYIPNGDGAQAKGRIPSVELPK